MLVLEIYQQRNAGPAISIRFVGPAFLSAREIQGNWILRLLKTKTSSGPESGNWWEMPIRFIKGPREIRQKPEKPGDNSRKESWAPGLMDLGRGPGVFRLEIYGA